MSSSFMSDMTETIIRKSVLLIQLLKLYAFLVTRITEAVNIGINFFT